MEHGTYYARRDVHPMPLENVALAVQGEGVEALAGDHVRVKPGAVLATLDHLLGGWGGGDVTSALAGAHLLDVYLPNHLLELHLDDLGGAPLAHQVEFGVATLGADVV